MHHIDKAVSNFELEFNCSQSVFSAFTPHLGLEPELALRIASPFGGGMGRSGETCGAVSGALMALGLHAGNVDPQDKAAKERTYELAREFLLRFEARHGTALCRELIEIDMNDPQELARAQELNIFKTRCPDFVRDAAEILTQMLEEI